MVNILLVDDERVILEGISGFVNWSKLGAKLAGTARNGIEALEWIMTHKPDIVITDIRMPGLDGLQLIERVREQGLQIRFIMLSGYSDFEYARSAMRYGVKHYLLKPCNEDVIEQALADVINEWEQSSNKEQFQRKMEDELQKMLPHAKEQLLKEFVTNKTYGIRDWVRYRSIFGLSSESRRVRLVLVQVEGEGQFEHLFALKNISEDIFGRSTLLLGTTIGEQVLLMIDAAAEPAVLFGLLDRIKLTFFEYYKLDATIAMSEPGDMDEIRMMYLEALECLNHRFYLGEGSIITKHDIKLDGEPPHDPVGYDDERIPMLIKAGRWEDVQQEIYDFFTILASRRLDARIAKSYVIILYTTIVRLDAVQLQHLMRDLAELDQIDTLHGLQRIVEAAAKVITLQNYEANRSRYSSIIRKVIEIVQMNVSNPELSLSGVANKMLYMNADYLGKLFKKETGEKFSNYVTKARMDKAIELIGEMEDVKVFELAAD